MNSPTGLPVNHNLLYPHHEASGAVLRPRDERTPLLGYGDVPAEYEAATSHAVIFDETDRGLVRVTGSEAGNFLHRLLSNQVSSLEVGRGNRNLLLTGKGKIRFDFDLACVEGGYLLSTPPGEAPRLVQGLDMYLFGEDVQLIDASEEHAPLLVCGPRAADILGSICSEIPQADHDHLTCNFGGAEVRVTKLAPYGPAAYRVDGGPALAKSLWEAVAAAGARPTGRIVCDILRVESCRALFGEDIDENVYPQEARLEEAINLSKGCYIGQEVVAKIDTYGGINKRLCALSVTHSDPVAPGSKLMRWSEEKGEWRELGLVTSWAYSFQHDTGQVLAYLKRRHQEPGTTFRIGEGPAEATVLE